MSELITRTVVELKQLGVYHELNKAYIDAGFSKKWESATFDEATRKVSFYTVPQPSGDVEPVFTFTLPEVDFTEIYNVIDVLEEKVDKNATDITNLRTDIDAINNEETGILKQSKDYTDAQINAAKEELSGELATTQEDLDALEETVAEMYTNEQIDGFVADAKKAGTDAQADVDVLKAKVGEVASDKTVVGMIAEEVARATAAEEANAGDIDALEDRANALEGKVDVLIGDDTGKSARTIANEELVKQLIADNAKESLDTLQEIAQWIQSHPDDASAMNKAIEDLEALVGTLPEGITATDIVGYIQEAVNAEKARAEAVEAELNARLGAVEQAVGEGGSVETQIGNAIADLDADITSATVEEGKGLQVQVVEVDGKVTTVAVTGNYDNSYDAKGAADNAKTESLAAVTALEEGQVATNTQAIADNAAAIAAIQYATEQDIKNLWN